MADSHFLWAGKVRVGADGAWKKKKKKKRNLLAHWKLADLIDAPKEGVSQ